MYWWLSQFHTTQYIIGLKCSMSTKQIEWCLQLYYDWGPYIWKVPDQNNETQTDVSHVGANPAYLQNVLQISYYDFANLQINNIGFEWQTQWHRNSGLWVHTSKSKAWHISHVCKLDEMLHTKC